jgi:hypothetical protein
MTRDDYQSLRTQYADIDDLCRRVERADVGEAYDAELGLLVEVLTDQQRAPEQIRSFVTHLGVPDDVLHRLSGLSFSRADDPVDGTGIGE